MNVALLQKIPTFAAIGQTVTQSKSHSLKENSQPVDVVDWRRQARDYAAMPLATGITMGLPPAITAAATAVNPGLGALSVFVAATGLTALPGLLLWNSLGGTVNRDSFQGAVGAAILTSAVAGIATYAGGLNAGLVAAGIVGAVATGAELHRTL